MGLPQDNAHNEMLAARGKAAINSKINNSNFGPLHETKDLHASPASIGRIKNIKNIEGTTPMRAHLSEIAGAFSAYSAFSAFFFWRGHKTSRAKSKTQPGAARQIGGGKNPKMIIFAKVTEFI
jgi:hypothetical protein